MGKIQEKEAGKRIRQVYYVSFLLICKEGVLYVSSLVL